MTLIDKVGCIQSNFPTCFGYSVGIVSDPQIHCWDPAAILKLELF